MHLKGESECTDNLATYLINLNGIKSFMKGSCRRQQ